MMGQLDVFWVKEQLDRLPYVKWDRFIFVQAYKPTVVRLFGWISREQDSYKDFVILELVPEHKDVYFLMTSSMKYTEDIAKRLGTEHKKCHSIDELRDTR